MLKRFLLEFHQDGAYKYFVLLVCCCHSHTHKRHHNATQRFTALLGGHCQQEKFYQNRIKVLTVDEDDLVQYFRGSADEKILEHFSRNTMRYCKLVAEAAQDILLERQANDGGARNSGAMTDDGAYDIMRDEDIAAVISRHRAADDIIGEGGNGTATGATGSTEVPRVLRMFYPEVHVAPARTRKVVGLRSVRSSEIGRLVVVRGIVTRASEVKPLARAVAYMCDQCKHEVFQEVQGTQFMPLERCTRPECTQNAAPGMLTMEARGSKFCKFQEVRIQEPTDQVPNGHIPRCVNVRLEGELTRRCTPGDVVTVTGVFLPTQHTGGNAQATAYTLVTDTHIHALGLAQNNKDSDDSADTVAARARMAQRVKATVEALTAEERPHFLARLARSIAPEIYGMEDVKRALLLQMVGAPTQVQSTDGMKIRGDINVLLLGDPGVAKSQLLKHVAQLTPRGVYTSGKGSSGVGLMAAVVRDQTTGEFVLEGGSLVLADMGICCIDEFDKMDDADKTAIHEVMEQQTISIAKAGITTTLNARTAILAAANPVNGRYLLSRTPGENINMPAALLSRFDLLFILLDTPEPTADRAKADHIISVHVSSSPAAVAAAAAEAEEEAMQQQQHQQQRGDDGDEGVTLPGKDGLFTSAFLRAYILEAKKCTPVLEGNVVDFLVNIYVNLRKEEKLNPGEGHTYTSARSLLGLIRLSQAMARLRFATSVAQGDVEEALRLMVATKAAIVRRPRTGGAGGSGSAVASDPKSLVFGIIRDSVRPGDNSTAYADVLKQVLVRGFTEELLRETIADYEQLGILTLSTDGSVIRFVTWDSGNSQSQSSAPQ